MKLDTLMILDENTYGLGLFINYLSETDRISYILIYLKIINDIDDNNFGSYLELIMLILLIAYGLLISFVEYFFKRAKNRYRRSKN